MAAKSHAGATVIEVNDSLHEVVSETAKALRENDLAFTMAGQVVDIHKIPTITANGLQSVLLPAPSVAIRLATIISKFVRFQKTTYKDKKKTVEKVPAPMPVLEAVIASGGEGLAPLTKILKAPTLRPDGSVLEKAGYDPDTGLFLSIPAGLPHIPHAPSQVEAQAALATLQGPIRGFPFCSELDRTVAISAILTGLIAPTLSAKPAVAISANAPGTGKTLLVKVITTIISGQPVSSGTDAKQADETEKRLDAALLKGDPIISLDNLTGVVGGAKLCMVVTDNFVEVRPLGKSLSMTVATPLVFLNGNNLTFSGDISRRVLVCNLDANCPEPELRQFDFNCVTEAQNLRPKLIVATLTIMRAYAVAGSPCVGLPPLGSFEDWSRLVRDALVWLGQPDVSTTVSDTKSRDRSREALRVIIHGWHQLHGNRPFRAADLVQEVRAMQSQAVTKDVADDIFDALLTVSGTPTGEISIRKLGMFLGASEKRNINGKWVERSSMQSGNNRWCIVP